MTTLSLSKTKNESLKQTSEAPTILCVDDDVEIVAALERSFHRYRVKLCIALHGMQGITEAVQVRPDVIVTDLQMPFATGEELIDCLSCNAMTSGVPIIVITGRSGERLTPQLERQGVVALLTKPFHFDDLISELSKLVKIDKR